MTEDQFWERLRVAFNEVDNDHDRSRLGGWCDWFEAKKYRPSSRPPCIIGKVSFVNGSASQPWRFRLLLDREYTTRGGIAWERQLPSVGTDWFRIDGVRGEIDIVGGAS